MSYEEILKRKIRKLDWVRKPIGLPTQIRLRSNIPFLGVQFHISRYSKNGRVVLHGIGAKADPLYKTEHVSVEEAKETAQMLFDEFISAQLLE